MIQYIPNFVPQPDKTFTSLRDELTWERRETTPRCEYYCNDNNVPDVYGKGKGERLYNPQPYHDCILNIRKDLEVVTGSTFEVCFLNRYLNQSDSLGWHADDSPEMDDARPIGVVSLGVEREIWFRENASQTIQKLTLGHGSLCVMPPGYQDTHMHRIPKASFQCGERISLTFRGYVT